MENNISGMMIYYFFVCERKLWYFSHEIRMESGNDDIAMGKLIDSESYAKEEKHINIDNVINIDYIKETKVLHEVKKSRSVEKASEWQLKYYLYYLKEKGVNGLSGRIDYPLLHKSADVFLDDNDIKKIEKYLCQINDIVSLPIPPEIEKKTICTKCAYRDLCLI